MSTISDKRIAFITGANRGIGLETARQLARAGVYVVIGARSEEAGQDAVSLLSKEGLQAGSLGFDVTSASDRMSAYQYFEKLAGRLDILINNAGIHLEGEAGVEHLYSASTVPEDVLRKTMEVNCFAPMALTQTLLPLLRKSAAGRIVNLSSILGSLTLGADPSWMAYQMKSTAYDMSKTAINAYTIQLAYELRDEPIKVNSAHPGWVQTEMGGSAAPMKIEDGAATSVKLATLPADGPSGGFFHLDEKLPW